MKVKSRSWVSWQSEIGQSEKRELSVVGESRSIKDKTETDTQLSKYVNK